VKSFGRNRHAKEAVMTTRQGDLSLLDHPVAQRLLRSHIPANLAYHWTDGTPRVVPIGFHWNGKELFMGTFPDAPKMKALKDGTPVAISIENDRMPYNVLLIRGPVRIDIVQGIAPEYEAMIFRTLGEEGGAQWLASMRPITPQMARLAVTPEWVGVLDFETRFPSALEQAIEEERANAQG
jgi:hypothetical protein